MSLLSSLFSFRKFNKNISAFALWDKDCKLSPKIFLGPFAKLYGSTIGNYTRIRHFTTVAYTQMGKFCSVAAGTKIGVAGHPTNLLSTNSVFYLSRSLNEKFKNDIPYEPYQPIIIGNDVWIGEKALVMPGVTIGDGAIIAAHAVVTKDVPPYAVAGGVPAKVIKYRFSEEMITLLEKIQWWNMDETKIEHVKNVFAKENPTIEDIAPLRELAERRKNDEEIL